jgi:hypothetical protein
MAAILVVLLMTAQIVGSQRCVANGSFSPHIGWMPPTEILARPTAPSAFQSSNSARANLGNSARHFGGDRKNPRPSTFRRGFTIGLDLAGAACRPACRCCDRKDRAASQLPRRADTRGSTPARATNELAQQRKFAAGEGNVAPICVGERASVEIELKIPEPDGRASRRQ